MRTDRSARLKAEYLEMLKIQDRPYLSWVVTKGEPPYAEEYLLTVRLRTYALSAKDGVYTVGVIHSCTVRMTLWDSFPEVAPNIRMLDIPPVFHPSWYSRGTYCPPEPWSPDCSLKDYVLRMLSTIMYDPSLIDSAAPANYKALEWYMRSRGREGLFPSDSAVLSENDPAAAARIERASAAFAETIDSWPAGQ